MSLHPLAPSLSLHFIEPRRAPDAQTSSSSLVSQISHRLNLVEYWDIKPGPRVLEIGCGQGDTTIALAHAVGGEGWVDALDAGSLDYGSPSTLGQAQAHIKASPLGPRIRFHCPMDPIDYLTTYVGPRYDYAVFSHSIFYFSHPSTLPRILNVLKPHTTKICIAEWSLSPSLVYPLQSIPHILATVLGTHIESHRKTSTQSNIMTVLSPGMIKDAVLKLAEEENTDRSEIGNNGKWTLKKETLLEVGEMKDAHWEVMALLAPAVQERVLSEVFGESGGKERAVVEVMFDALRASFCAFNVVRLEEVRCMRAWVGVFGVGVGG